MTMQRARVIALCVFATAGLGTAGAQTTPWYERIQFSGDFRARYEGFYQEDRPTRNRARLRVRVGLETPINEDTRFNVRIASGDPGTPVSTNQTFTGFFLPKPISLDRAFITYSPKALPALTAGAGKFPAPQTATQMVFDEDLNFEGAWEAVSFSRGNIEARVVGLQTAVNELSGTPDAYMMGGYGEVGVDIGKHALHFSVADYGWGNPDQIAVASSGGPLESILTNQVIRAPGSTTVIGFASRFNVVDIIAEDTITLREGVPLRLLVDFATNTKAATDRDAGFWFEAEYGRARASRSWSAGYTFGWLEQDVTPSAFVFSDMPGTNQRLHMLEASYVPKAGLSLDVTWHLTQRLFPSPADVPAPWLSRLHLAAVVRF
jgi:hypothetical protein